MKTKKYLITDTALREAVKSCTKKLMRGQRGWTDDENLSFLEFKIEGNLRECLENYGGIEFEK